MAIQTPDMYGKPTAPFLSGLVEKLVDVSGDPRYWERQWLHSVAVWPWWLWSWETLPAYSLACAQVWSDIICFFVSCF